MPRRPPPSLNLTLPRGDNLINRTRADPASIDAYLTELLTINPSIFIAYNLVSHPGKGPCLASHLLSNIYEYVRRGVTPELQWDGDPSRPLLYYHTALLYSTLLGRAYAAVRDTIDRNLAENKPTPEALCRHSDQLWWVMSYIFILAFFSGPDLEPGTRYSAAILLLSAGLAMEKAGVKAKGKEVSPWYPELGDPDVEWAWWDLRRVVLETKDLPNDHTDPAVLGKQ